MGVRWYVAYPLSYRHVEALLEERGVPVDHATLQRWVVKYRPLLEAAFHRRKRSVWLSWRMDETYMKVKGQWYYLYRAVDTTGQTMDFLLTEHRDEAAALRFLQKAIRRHGVLETITIDGSAAHAAAIKSYNDEPGTAIISRQVKYLNNMVEQDHRGVKRVTRPMLGFKAFTAAQDTFVGIELRHMIKKRQMVVQEGDEGLITAEQFYSMAASSLHRPGQLPLHDLLSTICDKAMRHPADSTSRTALQQRWMDRPAHRLPYHRTARERTTVSRKYDCSNRYAMPSLAAPSLESSRATFAKLGSVSATPVMMALSD